VKVRWSQDPRLPRVKSWSFDRPSAPACWPTFRFVLGYGESREGGTDTTGDGSAKEGRAGRGPDRPPSRHGSADAARRLAARRGALGRAPDREAPPRRAESRFGCAAERSRCGRARRGNLRRPSLGNARQSSAKRRSATSLASRPEPAAHVQLLHGLAAPFAAARTGAVSFDDARRPIRGSRPRDGRSRSRHRSTSAYSRAAASVHAGHRRREGSPRSGRSERSLSVSARSSCRSSYSYSRRSRSPS
jgi:hypothetical protein